MRTKEASRDVEEGLAAQKVDAGEPGTRRRSKGWAVCVPEVFAWKAGREARQNTTSYQRAGGTGKWG